MYVDEIHFISFQLISHRKLIAQGSCDLINILSIFFSFHFLKAPQDVSPVNTLSCDVQPIQETFETRQNVILCKIRIVIPFIHIQNHNMKLWINWMCLNISICSKALNTLGNNSKHEHKTYFGTSKVCLKFILCTCRPVVYYKKFIKATKLYETELQFLMFHPFQRSLCMG